MSGTIRANRKYSPSPLHPPCLSTSRTLPVLAPRTLRRPPPLPSTPFFARPRMQAKALWRDLEPCSAGTGREARAEGSKGHGTEVVEWRGRSCEGVVVDVRRCDRIPRGGRRETGPAPDHIELRVDHEFCRRFLRPARRSRRFGEDDGLHDPGKPTRSLVPSVWPKRRLTAESPVG
jgi:hypothetical protein